ncbi:MAG: tetratricopeptide repeat protein [Sideroxyarcus sp.]
MSLLLDALKKSGEYQQQGTGLSNLTLEETSSSRTASSSTTASSRAAGETMFAAKKKKPAGFQWKLGLVPTTLLIALVLGSGYGYYVWLEIQPPKQQIVQRTAPPPPSAAPSRAAAPALVPFIPPLETSTPTQPTPVQPEQQPVTAQNEDFDTPRNRPGSNERRYKSASTGVAIKRKMETDTVTPALLDAYQAYQRGDYITAAQGYRQVLGNDAHNRDALLGLAAIAQQQGQDDAAQHYYRQLLVLDPRDPVALTALMTFAPDEGNTESRLKSLLADQPRSGALHFALGNYYADISSWGDAQQSYFNAHMLEPANAQFTFNLAVSLDHLGQRKLAAQYYQQALQLDTANNSGFDHAQAQQRLNELNPAH